MSELKNFSSYLSRLELYAQANNIKVHYTDNDDYGSYSYRGRRLKLDEDLTHSEEIASFLHELGHAMDDEVIGQQTGALAHAYYNLYEEKFSIKEKNMVVACEKRAWHYGRVIAKKLKIRLGKWFDIVENDCITTYEEMRTK